MTLDDFLRTPLQTDGAMLIHFAGAAVAILQQHFRDFEGLTPDEAVAFAQLFAGLVVREAAAQDFSRTVLADIDTLPTTPEPLEPA